MGITLLIPLIVQYGLPFVIELIKELETGKGTITSATLLSLHQKYGSMSAADYLAQAQPAPVIQAPALLAPPTAGLSL